MDRRKVLSGIAAAFAALWPVTAFGRSAKKQANCDPRLLGTWRSDKELTLKYWRHLPDLDQETRDKADNLFQTIFGKLTITFTESHTRTEYDEIRDSCTYRAIGSDANSVAIVWEKKTGDSIQHIHFESDDLYYVSVEYNVEFMRRVK